MMRGISRRSRIFTGLLCAMSATPSPAKAEDQPPELIVTAQRREQRLQDVGLAVSILTGDDLARQRVESINDLVAQVPGLQATPSPNDTPVFILRGVGFYETSVAAYPDVAVYLDQTPLTLPAFTKLTMFDLDRVEVLKGPQGTLFGNNATGGAINLVAARPQNVFGAQVSATAGRFGRAELDGHVTGPLTQNLTARLAIKAVDTGDWQRSTTRPDTLGATRTAAGRLLLDWQASDRLKVSLDLNGWVDQSDPEAPQLARMTTPADLQAAIGASGPTGTITADFALLHVAPAPANPRAADWNAGNRPFADNRLAQAALTTSWDAGTDLRLTAITSYVHYRMHNATEGDGTALADLDIVSDRAQASSFFQELRLSSIDEHDRLRWVAGAGLDRTQVYEAVDLVFPAASTGSIQGFSADTYDSHQTMSNEALFASLEYDVLPRLTLHGGARYTWALRRTVNGSYQTPGYVEPFAGSPGLTGLINTLWSSALTPLFCPGQSFTLIPPGGSVSVNTATCSAGLYRGRLPESNLSWRGGIDLHLSRDWLAYANIAKGWKNGSYPTISAPVFDQYQPVTQESLLAYEAGVKGRLGTLATLEASAFYDDYRNKQVRAKTVNPIFGIIDQLVNVPRSRILGAEAQATIRPAKGLRIDLSATWLDTRIEQYDGIIGDTMVNGLLYAVRAPFAGADLPFAPHWQARAAVDYSTRLTRRLSGFVGGSLAAQTGSYASLVGTAQDRADTTLPGHAVLDLHAGVETAQGWRVTLWGKNVGNRFYLTNAGRAYDTIIRYAGRPAEYGITVTRSWR